MMVGVVSTLVVREFFMNPMFELITETLMRCPSLPIDFATITVWMLMLLKQSLYGCPVAIELVS
ncbi:hypothetical protein ES703_100852 [subsurface metagenome]